MKIMVSDYGRLRAGETTSIMKAPATMTHALLMNPGLTDRINGNSGIYG